MAEDGRISNTWTKVLLVVSCALLSIGGCANPLLLRLYFVKGGKGLWFASWLQSAGFSIILIPLLISYLLRRQRDTVVTMKLPIFIGSAVIGLLTGADNYLYGYGVAKLPVSTALIVFASQLGFTALFAFLLVKQKFTAYSVNAVALLTVGAVVLALRSSGDRPEGVSNRTYALGFGMTLAASALYGLIFPMVQLMYEKAKQSITYTLVLEIQLVMSFFATVFCTVGMIVNRDFQAIPEEARTYELGETKYYMVAAWLAISSQMFFLGAIGVVYCASSLLSGIVVSVLLPITEILAIIIFNEKFKAEKGVALALSLWGFASYFYGEIKLEKKKKKKQQLMNNEEVSIAQVIPIP